MTIPVPGIYVIYNIQYSTLDVDLHWANVTDGAPVVGYIYNESTQNMLWNLQVVDEEQGLVQFVNLAGNNYAGVSGEIDGSGVIGTSIETTFKLHERKIGEYEIQTYNSELVWELPDGNNFTEIILSPPISFYDNQAWQFIPVDGN
ncbi:uncharacterized protein BJ212DRAFT_556246 [Suillus subaureus]|uniref:Ricin B lectin domain-containing protein n=1 Tax=Suillus subaureus TaxID=48587 RepID=A0A9P7DQC1_9AGAM|nr:uncharacterized protein BJ212DRAFT_110722 [Suillus subaureus]XP_041198657.1 uncharacterized protein BJ212DRAFT_556246 [Suillus subaureus]KAG1800534.1 hypothetical protein BJ212DRAFT_110722 [Suillus subaureus]KAG1824940.1 hypothetical protein BJ212DRAFT_556246 [Suillus subaureus]